MKSLAVKIWIMVLATAVLGYGAYAIASRMIQRREALEKDLAEKKQIVEKAKQAAMMVVPKPVALESFTMFERSGKKMSLGELRGQVWIGSMFFASCPNECRQLNQTVAALHNDPLFKDVKFVSITVDPAVDTPEALSKTADLLGADKQRWLFFSGDLEDVARLGKQANVEAGYKSHVRRLLLFDRQGRVRGYFTFDDPQQIAKLREEVPRLLAEKEGEQESEVRSQESKVSS